MELQAALDAAHAADQATRQFLTMMSHELRTPMQAIMGYAELLLAGPKRSLTPEQVEDVQTIKRGANRLVELVKQMLDISRLDAGQLELNVAPVSLASIVEAVRQDVAPQGAAKALTFTIDIPADLPPVLGDEMGVHQILLNLVGNAVKFTERGEVRISAEAREDQVAVVVRDTGIGIAAETLPHIFEEFHQVDRGMTRRYEGAGLGLTIARRLAERMGGRLSAESRPGVGSTFTLHLPAALPSPSAEQTSPARLPTSETAARTG
jgi:signal transduction histidine kinase